MDPFSRSTEEDSSRRNEMFLKIMRISYKDHVTNEEVRSKIQQYLLTNEQVIIIQAKNRTLQAEPAHVPEAEDRSHRLLPVRVVKLSRQ